MKNVLDFLFPQICVGCGNEGSELCASCIASMTSPVTELGNMLIHSLWTLAPYTNTTMRRAVHRMKYQHVRSIATNLGIHIAHTWQPPTNILCIVVPMPMHPRRERARGFNHAQIIAQTCAQIWNIPMIPILRFRRVLPQQSRSSITQRIQHMSSSITLNPVLHHKHQSMFHHTTILLVDDVVTTGMSLYVAASTCQLLQPKTIIGIAAARG